MLISYDWEVCAVDLRFALRCNLYPAPAAFGCVSSLLREYAFERHVVTPEDSIYKMTFAPAK